MRQKGTSREDKTTSNNGSVLELGIYHEGMSAFFCVNFFMSQKNFFSFHPKKVANKSKRVGCLFIPFNVPLKTLWGVASVVNEKTRVKLKKPADR